MVRIQYVDRQGRERSYTTAPSRQVAAATSIKAQGGRIRRVSLVER